MALAFLDFDASEGGDGSGTFDAMATVAAAHWPALQAELAQVLAWCQRQFPGGRGPLDEGGTWDLDLQAREERSRALPLDWDGAGGRLAPAPATGPETLRYTVSLSIVGTPAFSEAFRARFLAGGDD